MQSLRFNGYYSIRVQNVSSDNVESMTKALLPGVPQSALLSIPHSNGIEVICDDRYNSQVKEALLATVEAINADVKNTPPDMALEFQEHESLPVNEGIIQSLRQQLEQHDALNFIKGSSRSFEAFHRHISALLQKAHMARADQ